MLLKIKTFQYFVFACVLLFSVSCRKKEIIPPPGATAPIFVANGTFGNEQIALQAGENNVIMSTEVVQLNGVSVFTGKLGNSKFSVEMGIFSGDIDLANPPVPNLGSENFIDFAVAPSYPLFRAVKDSFPNKEFIQKIKWEVNGEMKGIDVLEITEPGKYQICAHVTFFDYTEQTVCNEVIVGFKTSADFKLNYVIGQNHTFQSIIKSFGSNVSDVKWFMDGNIVGNNTDLSLTLDTISHLLRAEVLFTNGVKRIKTVLVDGSLTGKNIHDFSNAGLSPILLWDYKAKVKIVKDGVVYNSIPTAGGSQKITVTDVQYYGVNAQAEPVYKLRGTIDVNMVNNAGNSVPLLLDVTFGIAVK